MECEWSPALEDPKACPMPPKQFTAESAWKLVEFLFYISSTCGSSRILTHRGKTTVIVSVPGAYTPTCHGNHAPGFVSKAKEFTEKGAQVYIVSYNDPFVMSGWRSALGAKDEVHFATEFDLGLSKFVSLSFSTLHSSLLPHLRLRESLSVLMRWGGWYSSTRRST